jgi:hypothetical protein
MSTVSPTAPTKIGRTDVVSIPALGMDRISCRIDSGAALCALHMLTCCEDNGVLLVQFDAVETGSLRPTPWVESFTHYKTVRVKNSFGDVQDRFAVWLEIELFGQPYGVWVGLTSRASQRHPLLLGRNLLRQGFNIDVRYRNLSWKKLNASHTLP